MVFHYILLLHCNIFEIIYTVLYLTFKSTVIVIYTTSFNARNYILPTGFVWFSQ